MPTIRLETAVADADAAWDALRDFGALHVRLAPGFATDVEMDGADRIVTFASGARLREVLVTSDDTERRLVWTVVDGPYRHHNGAAQVIEDADGARFVWTADLLAPDEVVAATREAMQAGIAVIGRTLSGG